MTASAPRRIRVLVALAALAGASWTTARVARAAPATPTFHAEPAVEVVEPPANGSASGAIVLHNDTAASIVVGSITAEPGCDTGAVHAAPLTGFTLVAGATQTIDITCTPAPASMQRCDYRVRSPSNAVLLELEAVCAYAGATSLSSDLTEIHFGTVPIGGQAARTIALRNASSASLARLFIETTDLGGNFAVATPCNPDARECDAAIAAVPAGATTNAVVTCTPRAIGLQSALLYIATSAGTRLAAPISLTCTGAEPSAPVISVVPSSIDLGAVELMNATATATLHVSNAGSGTLRLIDVQIVDDGAGAAPDWTYIARTTCEPGIPPTCMLTAQTATQTADLDVAFDPRAIGVRDATLLINYRDTADRSISIPLHAIGRGPTLDLIGGKTTLDFGALPLAIPAALTFQVVNRGNRGLTDGSITLTPPGPPFTVTPGPAFTVATAAPTTFAVTCTPTAAGPFTTTLHLAASDVQSSPIDISAVCAGDAAIALSTTPPAVLLGEVRLGTELTTEVPIASDSPIPLSSSALAIATPSMRLRGAPPAAPATLELVVTPQVEGSLANHIVVTPKPATPDPGPPLAIAVIGTAVTAEYSAPAAVSLGTFCVEQPTTRRIIQLASTGTATIAVAAPALRRSDSPFDLQLIAPLSYPATLPALQRAIVAVTPRRNAVAGFATDDLIWTTDVADSLTFRTRLTATFVDNGGAIAPGALFFGSTAIHLDARNAQQVTLQNCDVSPLQLDVPQIAAPFSIDSPPPPTLLRPGQTVTFSVGFHPTKLGEVTKTLVITSPQLQAMLTVMLTGTGVAEGDEGNGGVTSVGLDQTSFYACGSCASSDASGTIAIALAALCVLLPRRRRHRR